MPTFCSNSTGDEAFRDFPIYFQLPVPKTQRDYEVQAKGLIRPATQKGAALERSRRAGSVSIQEAVGSKPGSLFAGEGTPEPRSFKQFRQTISSARFTPAAWSHRHMIPGADSSLCVLLPCLQAIRPKKFSVMPTLLADVRTKRRSLPKGECWNIHESLSWVRQ